MFGLPDTYTVKARIFPVLLAAMPGLALAAVMVSWRQLGLSHVIASGAAAVLLYAFADLSRRLGKAKEQSVYQKLGGKPTTAMLRHRDQTFDAETKDRWLEFLTSQLKEDAPSAKAEQKNPIAADHFYERCGNWLREHTRDQKRFKLVFEELVTYGFRRNLLGVKWPGLALNALVVLVCVVALRYRFPIVADDDISMRLIYVLIVATAHALYFLVAVNEKCVVEAAQQYARELILSCEKFLGQKVTKKAASMATKSRYRLPV